MRIRLICSREIRNLIEGDRKWGQDQDSGEKGGKQPAGMPCKKKRGKRDLLVRGHLAQQQQRERALQLQEGKKGEKGSEDTADWIEKRGKGEGLIPLRRCGKGKKGSDWDQDKLKGGCPLSGLRKEALLKERKKTF